MGPCHLSFWGMEEPCCCRRPSALQRQRGEDGRDERRRRRLGFLPGCPRERHRSSHLVTMLKIWFRAFKMVEKVAFSYTHPHDWDGTEDSNAVEENEGSCLLGLVINDCLMYPLILMPRPCLSIPPAKQRQACWCFLGFMDREIRVVYSPCLIHTIVLKNI